MQLESAPEVSNEECIPLVAEVCKTDAALLPAA